jgi:hypothetical protein
MHSRPSESTIWLRRPSGYKAGLTSADIELYKYRQNSSDLRRGASYGWRIYALYHRSTGKLYPILLFLKTDMQDASDAVIEASLREMKDLLGYCLADGCVGRMIPGQIRDGTVKLSCNTCGVVTHRDAP